METRINPQKVSHIQIYDAHKGYRWSDCIQEFEYKTFKKYWLFKTNKDGYYNVRGWDNYFKELPKGCYDLLGELYSYAKAEIFSGGKQIKTEYFESIEQAKEYCDKNFKEVNVIC
jgi:hypothetical protein